MSTSKTAHPEPISVHPFVLMRATGVPVTSWGDLSFDQADGFAPASEPEAAGADVSDERGYGFGV